MTNIVSVTLTIVLVFNLAGCVGFSYSGNKNFPVGKVSPDGKFISREKADDCGCHEVVDGRFDPSYLVKPNTIPNKKNSDGSETYVEKIRPNGAA